MILDQVRVEELLALAHRVGRRQRLHDVHVSPYEVIFHELSYRPDPERPGLHSLEGANYLPPAAGKLRIHDAAASDRLASRAEVPRSFSMLMLRKQYAHIGPAVLGDHMALSGIGKSLLIPVTRPGADPDEQTRMMFELYRDDPRFDFAYCPRLHASLDQAAEELDRARALHPIRAAKINANIQGLDLSEAGVRAGLGHLLAACRAADLPLIVHGGISRLLPDPRGRRYASLERLATIPWGESGTAMVLCHAGLFGCPSDEVRDLLPVLEGMLDDNPRLLVDVSGLAFSTLCTLFERLDPRRVVFGSDALYFPQWSAVVKVLLALEQLGLPVEERFAMLAGSTPQQCLWQEGG
jgi:hypothetical protein